MLTHLRKFNELVTIPSPEEIVMSSWSSSSHCGKHIPVNVTIDFGLIHHALKSIKHYGKRQT